MAYGELGTDALKAENVEKIVTGFALQNFVFRQLCSSSPSSSWKESYYRESKTELTATAKVARLAAFPQQSPLWEKNSAYMQKHGLEADIAWEDVMTDEIDVIARTLVRIGRAIVKSEDDLIYTTITDATGVLSFNATATWDNATRANRLPHDDVGNAIRRIQTSNYEPTHLLVTPYDYFLLRTNDNVVDAWTEAGQNIMQNGNMGNLIGLTVLKSNSVTADEACVLEAKTAASLKIAEDVRTLTKREEGIKYTVRGWVISVPYVTNPESICMINNVNA